MAFVPQPLVGGSLSLDLMNTIWQRDGAPYDWLETDAAVADFAERNLQPIAAADVAKVRQALMASRELIGRILAAPGDSSSWTADVDEMLSAAVVSFDAEAGALKIVGTPAVNQLATAAVIDVLELIGERPERLRSCDNHECSLWFLDTSKAGRRRWCSMETCGNRAKARRHHAKSAGEGRR